MDYEVKITQKGAMVICPNGERKWFATECEADEWIEDQKESHRKTEED